MRAEDGVDEESPIVGVWRLESITTNGRTISGGLTHLVVRRAMLFEVAPTGEGIAKASPVRRYDLEREGDDLLVTIEHERRGSLHVRVAIDGDRMQWRWAARDGEVPVRDDARGTLEVFSRETNASAARAASAAGPRDVPARLRHPVLGWMVHDEAREVWARGALRDATTDARIEIEGSRTATLADLDRALAVIRRAPLADLGGTARDELAWLDRRTGGELAGGELDDLEETEGDPLEARVIRARRDGGLRILFEGGIELDVDASFEVEEASYAGDEGFTDSESAGSRSSGGDGDDA